MKITITPQAAKWFKTELSVDANMGVRFYGKVYGKTQVHEGFSVGMSVDTPENPIAKTTVEGILFFADEADEWFFKGYDLTVDLDEKLNEPKYLFTED
ncbi:iron-sulfur cluster biosynthesis protein [Enterococcus saigonensis]|uniref:Iron-sulfur cluster biosynthesis protein n=1 Tax=Enterococcus saigonensis TaxID=1805431 RepID=A0A679IAV1_9ENTE|nr:iron-sulfur cluster biosynthesis protein [Enterococcus saigonensis]BCA85443.1 iron-sulfur cluster biosynthesis protein [Enterococcus saigonensis]